MSIHAGDQVYTKFRGGKREGEVCLYYLARLRIEVNLGIQVETLYDKSGEVVEGSGGDVNITVNVRHNHTLTRLSANIINRTHQKLSFMIRYASW